MPDPTPTNGEITRELLRDAVKEGYLLGKKEWKEAEEKAAAEKAKQDAEFKAQQEAAAAEDAKKKAEEAKKNGVLFRIKS